jgi:hypothetical protein
LRASPAQAVILAAGLLLGGLILGAASGCQPAVQQVEPGGGVDRAIKATVELNLKSDPRTQSSPIQVGVSGRVVTLTGQAAGSDAKAAAVEIAKKIPDVTQVVDEMTVGEGVPAEPATPRVPTLPDIPEAPAVPDEPNY